MRLFPIEAPHAVAYTAPSALTGARRGVAVTASTGRNIKPDWARLLGLQLEGN